MFNHSWGIKINSNIISVKRDIVNIKNLDSCMFLALTTESMLA